jgi:hypothetical protein
MPLGAAMRLRGADGAGTAGQGGQRASDAGRLMRLLTAEERCVDRAELGVDLRHGEGGGCGEKEERRAGGGARRRSGSVRCVLAGWQLGAALRRVYGRDKHRALRRASAAATHEGEGEGEGVRCGEVR